MLPRNHPDRIQIAFDDHRLVANAGLILPATLALRLGLPQLLRKHLDLGGAPGRANTGDKMMTLVASALAGGDCIDDADVLRAGGTARVLGFTAKAPSTLGTFLRSFRWGHVRQLDRVSRELLARVWKAGAGPGDAPFTIDLDSTICETYGLAKEGARHHGYTGARGYHPLLAVAAGTGDVLLARLREGRANTARGAAHFLRETVGRVRYCGARGQLTVRADSGFYTHAVVAVCRRMDVRFSIAIRQRARLRNLIEAIPEDAWTPIPYWMDGFTAGRLRDCGLFMERGAERFAGMVVVPDASGGLVRWLVGRAVAPDRTPRFQALPGPKPVLGMGRLGPAPSWTVVAEGVFDWIALTGWGLPAAAALGTQGVERVAAALRGCPRVFLAFDNDDAGREATERLQTLLGRRAAAVALPEGVGDVAELAARPHGRAAFLRLLAQAARSAR